MILAGSIFEAAHHLEAEGKAFGLVTLVATRGYAPQDVGAKALVSLKEGLRFGTIGGGKVEAKAILRVQEKLSQSKNYEFEKVTWNLQSDVGMSCGGEVEMIIETFAPSSWKVVIFGAGHVSQALVRILLPLKVQVTCIDPRTEWTSQLPTALNLTVVIGDCVAYESGSDVLVMTRGHATDFPVLVEVLKRGEFSYLGCIGSEVKAIRIRKELKELGFLENQIKQLHCPMGKMVGDNSPQAIAISIAAHLLQNRQAISIAYRGN